MKGFFYMQNLFAVNIIWVIITIFFVKKQVLFYEV
jgi:hypothetical protein